MDGSPPGDMDDGAGRDRAGRPLVERVARPARGPSAWLVTGFAIGAIVVALLKPWGVAAPTPTDAPGPVLTPVPVAVALATASPRPVSIEAMAAGLCYGIAEWRIVAGEEWLGRNVRTWEAATGVVATNPLDSAIVPSPIIARSVPALGFCAPVAGPDRPPDDALVTLWQTTGGQLTVLQPAILEPPVATPFGRLWAPPGSAGRDRGATWAPGEYVIRIASVTGAYQRWLGLEVIPPSAA